MSTPSVCGPWCYLCRGCRTSMRSRQWVRTRRWGTCSGSARISTRWWKICNRIKEGNFLTSSTNTSILDIFHLLPYSTDIMVQKYQGILSRSLSSSPTSIAHCSRTLPALIRPSPCWTKALDGFCWSARLLCVSFAASTPTFSFRWLLVWDPGVRERAGQGGVWNQLGRWCGSSLGWGGWAGW